MSKRGQLTIIIIIAVIIVALALTTFFLWPQISALFMNQEQSQRFLASQAEPLRQSVSDCVKEASLDVFQKIGLQAGYYDPTGLKVFNYLGENVIVVMYKDSAKNRINKLPSLSQVEQQYNIFLERGGYEKIDSCLNNLDSFKRVMKIETGERKITPVFYDNSITLVIDWPMKLSKGEVSQSINQKNAELPIPFGKMWKNADAIVECETQISCAYEGNYWDKDVWNNPLRIQYIKREAVSLNKDQIIFLFESIPSKENDPVFKFNFAIDRT
jgi:uncharacterized protein YpmB